ncbi:substrate-binding domain-containing protein [Defluviitalea phaphyphila]|uniref:substrate-binding domain-containing protein n=1 Tax=Defluviitalea phaphyphila TaxID=1473580 RepID=UPI00072FC852|nr:substrate-binding domain-containing protein [Defluviitalea phaphyphila]
MNYLKKTIIFLFVVLFCFLIVIYMKNKEEKMANKEGDKIVIGFAMDTLVHERWLRDRDIFTAVAKELGAEVIIQTANSDSKEQEKQVKYLLDNDIDILVLVPHDAEYAERMVREAKSRGVKVIAYDRLVKNANVDLYISFDNVKVGELMGKAIIEAKPEGNYILLNGSKSDNNSFLLNEGYYKVLEPMINNKKINIIGETWVKDWLYENAFQFTNDILAENIQVDGIIAANDTLAAAAVNALSEKRLAGKVAVVAQDADLDACQRVVEGTQLATVYKPIDILVKTAVQYAIDMAKGKEIQTDETIYDGKYEVPYYKIEPVLVTKENMMDTVIADNFHSLEDVYMNVPKFLWPNKEK